MVSRSNDDPLQSISDAESYTARDIIKEPMDDISSSPFLQIAAASKSSLTHASQFAVATRADTNYCTAAAFFLTLPSTLGVTLEASAIPKSPMVPNESIVTKYSATFDDVPHKGFEVVSPNPKSIDVSITSTDTVMTASTSLKFGSSSSLAEVSKITSEDLPLVKTTTTIKRPLGEEITKVASNAVSIAATVTISTSLGAEVNKVASNLATITTTTATNPPDAEIAEVIFNAVSVTTATTTSNHLGAHNTEVASDAASVTTATTLSSLFVAAEITGVVSEPVSTTTTAMTAVAPVNVDATTTCTNTEVIPSTSSEITDLSHPMSVPDTSIPPASQTATEPLDASTIDSITVHPEATSPPFSSITDDITPSTSTAVVASNTIPAGGKCCVGE